jgi:hypothetical protein
MSTPEDWGRTCRKTAHIPLSWPAPDWSMSISEHRPPLNDKLAEVHVGTGGPSHFGTGGRSGPESADGSAKSGAPDLKAGGPIGSGHAWFWIGYRRRSGARLASQPKNFRP